MTGRKIGYARVSKDDQDCEGQRRALRADGCTRIYSDMMSGTKASREEFDLALASLRRGDTLVIFKLDRLGRRVHNLSGLVQDLKARGVHLRSLTESIDTGSASGMMFYHMVSAFAEYEREVIVERTNLGLAAARARGVRFGNPGFIARDPKVIAKMQASQRETFRKRARKNSGEWVDLVRRHRPHMSWGDLVRMIERRTRKTMYHKTLVRNVRHLVELGDLPASVLDRKPCPANTDARTIARRIARDDPSLSLRAIGRELEDMGVYPVRAKSWSAQTVSQMLENEHPPES